MEISTKELVFVPTPGMGHLLSAVEFAKLIIKRDQRISILILIINVPLTSSMINSFVDSQSRDNPYPTRLKFHTLPTPPDLPDPSSPTFFQTFIELHKLLVKEVVEGRVRDESIQLSGFVLDMFCTTMVDVANKFKVPSYVFFTSGASLLTMMFHFQSLCDDQGFDIANELSNPGAEFEVPGFRNRVPSKVIPGVFKEGVESMILGHARRFRSCNGILVNTFCELESQPFKALFDQVAKGSKDGMSIPPVYPVGPILELDNRSASGSHGEEHESIMKWLDDQPASSVVFLCFGSMGCFDANQVREIAKGLENSGHRFLWSLRQPPPEGKVGMPSQEPFIDALPEGFQDRTVERGKIIGWAPQVSVLGHQAIGGFVSHCGWNSTMESLWFGVPMATWPLYAEQQLNAFELVKELGLAVEIRMDHRLDWKSRQANFQVSAEEIENRVRKLMSMDEEAKKKVREMRDKGRKALEDGGSSHQWLGRFIENVVSNIDSN